MSTKHQRQHFWQWFERNNKEFLAFRKQKKKQLDFWSGDLDAHLKVFGRVITFTITLTEKGHPNRLTITACGRKKYFKKVDDLVAAAPLLPDWEIHALQEPVSLELIKAEIYGKPGISLDELLFTCEENNEDSRLRITVYSDLYTETTATAIEKSVNQIIWHLLGERSFVTDIRCLDVYNLSWAPENEFLFQLEQLPDFIGNLNSGLSIDPSGIIKTT